jgi:predicted anti-sigma-YlaC factor YlaD
LHLLLHWEWPDQVLWSAPIAAGVGGALAFLRWHGWFGRALVAVASLTLVVATVVSVGEWGWSYTVQADPLSGRPLVAVPFCLALAIALLSARRRPMVAVGS